MSKKTSKVMEFVFRLIIAAGTAALTALGTTACMDYNAYVAL